MLSLPGEIVEDAEAIAVEIGSGLLDGFLSRASSLSTDEFEALSSTAGGRFSPIVIG